jgi:hypothetical protein
MDASTLDVRDVVFTRHFYDSKAVQDSLRRALTSHYLDEGAFWCLELYQSELYNELLEILFEMYTLYVTPSAHWLHLFIQQTDGITLDGVMTLYNGLYYYLERPAPLYLHHTIPAMKQIDKAWKHDRSLLQWLQSDGPQWFDSFASDPEYVCERYIYVMSIADSMQLPPMAAIPAWNEWVLLTGRRQRRKFPIPQEVRSKHRDNMDISLLRGITLRDLVTCPYYNSLFNEMDAADLVYYSIHDMMDEEDDALYQQVHTRVFPDDVPDEWLFIDQNKSHGLLLYG